MNIPRGSITGDDYMNYRGEPRSPDINIHKDFCKAFHKILQKFKFR